LAEDLKDKAAEMVRKVLTVGVGAAFLTEESLRGLMSEFKLPKELLGGILESANKTKNEFFQNLSRDVINRVTERLDPSALVQEMLEHNEIELHVRVSFKPKGKKPRPGGGDEEA
jgi:hypothetical protein